MQSVHLNSLQQVILNEALSRRLEKRKREFSKKLNSHFHNPRLKAIFENLNVEFSDKLYEMPFKCYFSLYLYLILKSRVKYLDWIPDMPEYFKIGVSQDLNVMQLSREFGISRSSVRKAYKELVTYKLIEESPEIAPRHKSTKSIIVYNDYYVHSFDPEAGHVVYTSDIPFNFYNK